RELSGFRKPSSHARNMYAVCTTDPLIKSLPRSASEPRAQVVNQKCPNPVNAKKIKREKNDRYQRNDRRVFDFVCRRPRNAAHLRPGVAQKLHGSRKKIRHRGRAAPGPATAGSPGSGIALTLARRNPARPLYARGLGVQIDFVTHLDFVKLLCQPIIS